MNKFKAFLPVMKENKTENDELSIFGVASTSSLDFENDIMTVEAIKDMKTSTVGKPVLLDHNRELTNVCGAVSDVIDSDSSVLKIKADILPSFRERVNELLNSSLELGMSVGGLVEDYEDNKEGGITINKFKLLEISLTGFPANFDTMGTVVRAKSCIIDDIHKCCDNMKSENKKEEKNETTLEDVVSEINKRVSALENQVAELVADFDSEDTEAVEENKDFDEIKEQLKSIDSFMQKMHEEKDFNDKVASAVDEVLNNRFKSLKESRNPTPTPLPELDAEEEEKKDYTPSEIAKMMNRGSVDSILKK